MKLKHFFYIIAAVLLTVACSSKKEKAEPILRPASMDYTSQDSAEVFNLVSQFVEFFGHNDFESASLMLHTVHNDSIFPYTEEQRKDYQQKMQMLANYGCRMETLILRSDKNNEVRLKVKLLPIGTLDDDQAITHVYLNPVVIDGQWYLTLRDLKAEGVENIYEKEHYGGEVQ